MSLSSLTAALEREPLPIYLLLGDAPLLVDKAVKAAAHIRAMIDARK